ncbi:MAG: hypothetical protein AAF555_05095 [Verrucomicrobiota bacterium]
MMDPKREKSLEKRVQINPFCRLLLLSAKEVVMRIEAAQRRSEEIENGPRRPDTDLAEIMRFKQGANQLAYWLRSGPPSIVGIGDDLARFKAVFDFGRPGFFKVELVSIELFGMSPQTLIDKVRQEQAKPTGAGPRKTDEEMVVSLDRVHEPLRKRHEFFRDVGLFGRRRGGSTRHIQSQEGKIECWERSNRRIFACFHLSLSLLELLNHLFSLRGLVGIRVGPTKE